MTNKSIAVWIGSRKNGGLRLSRDMNFCWDPGIFTVLGITFCTDIDRISEIDYENKLIEIQRMSAMYRTNACFLIKSPTMMCLAEPPPPQKKTTPVIII